jgi:hypothetical protein
MLRGPSLTRVQPHPVFLVGGGEAEGPFQADPSTTHIVLGGVDEPCVTNREMQRPVSSRTTPGSRERRTPTDWRCEPVFLACFLCGCGPRK